MIIPTSLANYKHTSTSKIL